MKCIRNNDIYEEIIKRSRFISLIFKVYNTNEVNNVLNDIKNKYPDATHYCYAYVIDNNIKSSDDNEPSHTAGIPILNAINNNNLNYTLIIVVRYFGGIKLGVGPLTRSYAKVAREVIKANNIIDLEKGYDITLTFNYENVNDIDYILLNSKIINKTFNDNICYRAYVNSNTLNKLTNYNPGINKEIYIEKEWNYEVNIK